MTHLATNDSDRLEHKEELLSPAETRVFDWIKLDPTRPFCSRDITELPEKYAKGTARNILSKLHILKLIKIYCKDRYTFYIMASSNPSKIKKPVTVSHMGGSGLRRAQISVSELIDSMSWEEFCKIHDVRLKFQADGLYDLLLKEKVFVPKAISKDIHFGSFIWSKYRSVEVVLHRTETVVFRIDCGRCPVESSAMGFASMAAVLGGIRNELFNSAKAAGSTLNENTMPQVEDWIVAQWHYGRDSAQEFSGEHFNLTFKMWCGILARIYVHQQDRTQKLRIEVIQSPDKTLRRATAEKLNLCCSRCNGCSKQ